MIDNFHLREGKVEFRWKRWRNKKRQEVSSCLMVLLSGAVILGAGGVALAGPTGGQVTGGQGTITNPNGTTTNINQQSNVLNINWQDFSIQQGETVNFYQPGSTSVAINRVIGGVPSYLAGALNANGRVFILNSAGITFTGTSQVNVGALLATTAMTVNGDPTQAASYSGSGYGAVINQGSISVSNGGFAILAAPYVQNTGFIKADLGTIALAGTNQFTLDLSGTGLINFVVPAGAVEKIVSDGKAVGVDNAGTLQARSGQVLISANVASEVINAVVNLNGIVDADAFAANGQGGAVLVTSQGDINIGGQVTARGDGTGNGGLIFTKAAGGDDIKAMAYVSAVGGADGGKGGQIEVSGKQVGLHGTIKAGKGGSLLIDPQDILVVASSTGGLTPIGANSAIGTHFIENQLNSGVNVSLVANRDILFDALGGDHVLTGGSGNLNLVAGATQAGNILFGQHANGTNPGTQDAIQQFGGFIHMNANGGNIGSAAHSISLLSNSNPGVSAAGDIVLTAGNDIRVKDVTILSDASGSQQHALFTANAGHDFIASGNIDIEAHANSGQPSARATANILAHNNISLQGVQVVAVASHLGSPVGGSVPAHANLQVTAACANLTIDGDVNVVASALQHGSSGAQALAAAQANLIAGKAIDVTGNIRLSGFAQESGGSVAAANALLTVDAQGGDIHIGGDVDLNAIANLQGGDLVSAIAWANLTAELAVTVNGHIALTANANRAVFSASDTGAATASANLIVNAGHGDVVIGGSILEQGFAQSTGAGSATGCAQANISGNAISIGGLVKLLASAINPVSEASSVDAFANLQLHAGTGSINIHGDVVVKAVAASASSLSPLHRPIATARANLLANTNVTIGGSVGLLAFADHDRFPGNGVNATADLDIKSPGVITIVGDIDVEADAASNGDGGANAIAQAQLLAARVSLNGSVDIAASANQHGGSGHVNALANLTVSANGADLSAGDIIVSARAVGRVSDSVTANAQANLFGLNVTIDGNVAIVAIADEIGIKSAQALANLQVDAVTGNAGITGGVTVNAVALSSGSGSAQASALANVIAHHNVTLGSVDVAASAHASGFVRANAKADIFAQGSVTIGDVQLLASAKDSNSQAGSAVASANLLLQANSGSINIDRGIQDNAVATSGGSHHNVAATARANLSAAFNIAIGSHVEVSASGFHHRGTAFSVEASANLDARSQCGAVTIGGDLSVNAKAGSTGSGNVGAIAKALLLARSVSLDGGVDIAASASQQGGGSRVNALASLLVWGQHGNIQANSGVSVTAIGKGQGNEFVTANAVANVLAFSGLSISGGVDIAASAHDSGTSGNAARALANLQLGATGAVNIAGTVTVNAIALTSNHGTAQAIALANISAHDGVTLNGPVGIIASANQLGLTGGSVLANAQLLIDANSANVVTSSGIAVAALARSHGNHNVTANAQANIFAHTNLSIGGDVDVDASAQHFQGPGGLVRAQAGLQAGAGGNASFDGAVRENAIAVSSSSATVRGSALACVFAGQNVTLEQPVEIKASASQAGMGGSASANANLIINAGNVQADSGIEVNALAESGGVHNVFANAQANIFAAHNIVVDDDIDVSASDRLGGSGAHGVQAGANLQVHANAGSASIGGIHVRANGQASSGSVVHANALANIAAGKDIDLLGPVEVIASADQAHSGSDANAVANLVLHAAGGDVNADDVTVNAFAGAGGGRIVFASAQANVFAANDVVIGGDIDVIANAAMLGFRPTALGATARANLLIDALGGSASVAGSLSVTADALFSHSGSLARASALANITARNDVVLNGLADVAASAKQAATPSGGGAIANANLVIFAECGDVQAMHGIDVSAVADSGGFFNQVLATASANIRANDSVAIGTDASAANIDVTASADACGIAHANALLRINAGNLTVDGDVGIIANAVSLFDAAGAKANGVIDAGHDASIDGAVVIASADHQGPLANSAQASALLQIDAIGADLTLNHLNVFANVASQGLGLARAFAQGNLFAHGDITIASDAAVSASALHSLGLGPTRASANLLIDANFGRVNVDGDLIVRARGITSSGDSANVQALARVLGNTRVHLGSASVTALASPGGSAGQANALASLHISVQNGDAVIDHDVTVDATADNFGQTRARANAVINISAANNLNVGGNLQARALATEVNSGSASASANILLHVVNSGIGVQGNVDAIADAVDSGGHSAANALAQVTMLGGDIAVHGNIDVDASAQQKSFSGHAANALAELTINTSRNLQVGGDVAVSASAMASGSGPGERARANAVTDIAGGGNFNFHGDIHDAARAHQTGASGSNAIANANVTIHAGVLTVLGSIQENASATASGDANALALMSISVVTKASIEGKISIFAFADQLGGSANAAKATAVLDLRADSITVDKNVEINASALASGHSAGFAEANALASINAANHIGLHGIEIKALANQTATSGSQALASADLQLNGRRIDVADEIRVSASAFAAGSSPGRAVANALANIVANNRASIGDIGVAAHADASSSLGSDASALANLRLHASSIHMTGTVDVTASAKAAGDSPGIARATALADIHASHNIGLNSVFVKALAHQQGSGGNDANADAALRLTANNITVPGIIDVNAVAIRDGDNSGSALANALASVHGSQNLHLGDVSVTACAQDMGSFGDQALANANLQLQGGSIRVSNTINVTALATDLGSAAGIAKAIALANIAAGSHNASLNGVWVTAFANQQAPSGSQALASAQLQLQAGNIQVLGDVSVNASAIAAGANPAAATACALANIAAGTHNAFFAHDIDVRAHANETSASGNQARAVANLQMHAGSINVRGTIDVDASAIDLGRHNAQALALASITASSGDAKFDAIDVTAEANQAGHSGDAIASANLQLHAGNIHVDGLVGVNASAFAGGANALANALGSIAASHNASFAGDVAISAHGDQGTANGAGAQALANLQIDASSNLDVQGAINVAAIASGTGNAIADATVNLTANLSLTLGGLDATVIASQQDAAGKNAHAHLDLSAFASSILTIANSVNVNVTADNLGSHGNASAVANVLLAAQGGAVNAVDLGDVSVHVNALDHNGVGLTIANANVRIFYDNAAGLGGIQLHSLDVSASANELLGTANARARALADVFINAPGEVISSGRDMLVTANAFDGSSANAFAHLDVNAGHVNLAASGASGSIGARARATADGNSAVAHALASVDIAAATGSAFVHGNLIGSAVANYAHAGGNALGRIDATADVGIDAAVDIAVGNVIVTADAENFGDNSARGLASLDMNAAGAIDLFGNVFVNALADDHSAAGNGATFAASANAQAHFNAQSVNAINSSSVAVRAHALNAGHKAAKASAVVDFGAASFVKVGGLTLDVLADNSGQNGTNAIANAILTQTNAGVDWVIGSHGINVHAVADSSGTGGANAHASLNMSQNEIDINGPVLVEADAHAGANAVNGALAHATLDLNANSIDIGGNATVIANAVALGAGAAADASAMVVLHGGTGAVTVGSNLTANAFASGHSASANALISIDAASVMLGGIADNATANAHGGARNALASVNILGNNGISIIHNVELSAVGGASATAVLTMNAANGSINIANDVTVDGGTASANLFAQHAINIGGNVAVTADTLEALLTLHAESGDINIAKSVTVNGSAGSANMVAGDDIFVRGAITVTGRSNDATLRTKASDDIALADVTVTARATKSVNALFSASAAGGSFSAHDINVSASAGGTHLGSGVFFANATANIVAGQNASMNAVRVHAVDTIIGTSSFVSDNAQANLQINAATGNIHVNGNVVVSASANGPGGSTPNRANAFANLHAGGNVGVVGDVLLDANAFGFGIVHGEALLTVNAGGSIDLGGIDLAAAADAGPQASATAEASLVAGNGISVEGNVDLTALTSSGVGFEGANAFDHANLLMNAGAGGVFIGGNIDLKSRADAVGQSAEAQALVNILANTDIAITGNVTLSADAHQNRVGTEHEGHGARASASFELQALTGSINIGGDLTANAKALSDSGFADAKASANLLANTKVVVDGNLDLMATADMRNSGGVASANANLLINAGSINIADDLVIVANAPHHGHAHALANLLADHDIDVGGNVELTADGSQGANALLLMNAGGSIDIGSGVILDAVKGKANANLVAGTIIAGSVDITANGGSALLTMNASNGSINIAGNLTLNAVGARASANLLAHSDIIIGANADVTANQANAALLMNAQSGSISVGGDLSVVAKGGFVESGGRVTQALLSAHAGRNFLAHDVLDSATVGGKRGVYSALATANIVAQNDIVVSDVNVHASAHPVIANQLFSVSTATGHATANLQLNAVAGSIHVNGNVAVDAIALMDNINSVGAQLRAKALANLFAGKDVDVSGDVELHAKGNASSIASGSVKAILTINAGDQIDIGSINELAEANEVHNLVCAQANLVAGSGIVVERNIELNAQGSSFDGGGFVGANLQMNAGTGSVNVGGELQVRSLANFHHGASAVALVDILARTKVVIDGNLDVTVNLQNATGVASANANLLINAGSINIADDLVIVANAPDHGHADAFANLLADNDIDVGGNVSLNAAGSQAANALLVMNAGGSIDIGSGVILDAAKGKANADLVASTIIAGSVDIAANGGSALLTMNASNGSINIAGDLTLNAFGAKASANLLAASDIIIGGNADVMANQANATLLMNAQSGSISVGGDLSVIAKGGFGHSNGRRAQALLSAHAGRDFLAHNIVDSATVGGTRGVFSALATANIVAHNDIVIGNVNLHALAHAVVPYFTSGTDARATANLQLNAMAGSIHVNGNIAADAFGVINNFSSVGTELRANALVNLFAGKDVNVTGDVILHANEQGSGHGRSDQEVNAFLTVNAGDTIDIGGINELAEASVARPQICAQANLVAGSDIIIRRNVELNAHGNSNSGDASAGANLQMDAETGSVNIGGNLEVRSAYRLIGAQERASALVNILAGTDIHIGNGAIVSAEVDSHGDSHSYTRTDLANANLQLHAANGSIDIHGDVTVNALANVSGRRHAIAEASANLLAGNRILIGGSVDVSANAHQPFVVLGDARASASLVMNADGGSINVAHSVGVHADALDGGSGHAGANALMNLQANNGLAIGGSLNATAVADQDPAYQSWARACANIMLDVAHGDINVAKDIHASANALSKGSASAIADGLINATAALGDVLVNGAVTANAHAETSSQNGLNGALALSSITLHGDPVIVGSIVEHATASSHGTGHANAKANANVTADSITVNHNVDIIAEASQDSDNNALASANLMLHAVTGSIDIGSNLMLAANGGKASANLLAGTKIVLGNNADVTAHGGNAILSMNAATGSIDIGSDVSLFANGDGIVRARFSADAGGNVIARDIDISASANGELNQVADATANIHAGSDIALNEVNVSAAITFIQGARFTGSHAVTANIQLNAGSSIHVNGNVVASATAGASAASGMANAEAIANLVAAGNIDVGGNIALNAIASATSGGGGVAKALLSVDAGGLASVGGNISVTANAHAASSALANASANIVAGSLLLLGDVTGRATAIGGHGDHAFANLAMSASTGAVTVNGDIGAFAVADAASDAANASIAIIANGAITLNGADPIASARVGPGSGTTTAFRQANHTTHDGPVTGPGGVAYANILIQGSSSTGGPPPPETGSSLTQIEKLFALPTDTPTLTSTNTGLSTIQMLINGQDCGVFGSAGADANAIAKALACQKSPINVSDLTDSEP